VPSTHVKVTNRSSSKLVLTNSSPGTGTFEVTTPQKTIAPGDFTEFTVIETASLPAGLVTYGIDKQTHQAVVVQWNGAVGLATAKTGGPKSARKLLSCDPQEWHRMDDEDVFDVTIRSPSGPSSTVNVCVAPMNTTCIVLSDLKDLHRVFRGREEAALKSNMPKGADPNAYVIVGHALRLFADTQRPNDVVWTVSVTKEGKSTAAEEPEGKTWHHIGQRLKIPKVPPDWTMIRVEAQLGKQVRVASIHVEHSGVGRYIRLVSKLETKSGKTPDWVLNCLRGLAGYTKSFHDDMTGMSPVPSGVQYLSSTELNQLTKASAHASGGQTTELSGDTLAIGHVITGLCAGWNRKTNYTPRVPIIGKANPFYPFDNLWGETLAGDLGQAAVLVQWGKMPALIGAKSGAEESELRADIDGLVLGNDASSKVAAAGSVSALLEKYYMVRPNDPSSGFVVTKRMSQDAYGREKILHESGNFAFAFSRNQTPTLLDTVTGVDDDILGRCVDAYLDWHRAEEKRESSDAANARLGDSVDASEGFD